MRVRTLTRWAGLILCIVLVLAFMVSLRRYVSWTSSDARHEVSLILGAFNVVGPPLDWNLQNYPYASEPGWSIGEFGGFPRMIWWIERGNSPYARWVIVPLWLPGVAVGIPVAWLWYYDRSHVRESLRRWGVRLRPPRRLRVTFWRVAACAVVHAILVVPLFMLVDNLYGFFRANHTHINETYWKVIDWAAPILFWSAPLWGILWAWLYVRFRNSLLAGREGDYCMECGYNLTGNVSGVCPECGIRVHIGGESA